MAILDRLHTLIRAEFSHVTGRRDERDVVHVALRDARGELAQLVNREQREHRAYQDALDRVQACEDEAVAAMRRGDEATARAKVDDKHRADELAGNARDTLDATRRQVGDLRAALDALEYKLEAGVDRRAAGRAPSAPLGVTPGGPYAGPTWREPVLPASSTPDDLTPLLTTGVQASSAFDRFDEMSARMDDLEAGTLASAELDADGRGAHDPLHDAVSAKFRALELERMRQSAGDDDDDDPLERLRRRLGGDDA